MITHLERTQNGSKSILPLDTRTYVYELEMLVFRNILRTY